MARALGRPARDADDNQLLPFITSFDPSDLPGGSIDPLGFDRGVNFLADKLLPGLTNVARHPRYFSLLCAGAHLAPVQSGSPRVQFLQRQETILRLERLWVVANLLATPEEPLDARGIRGALYGRAHLKALDKVGAQRTGTGFDLLARQVPYGVIGIYGNVAAGMKLLDRSSLSLSPDLGDRLGEAFRTETAIPQSVARAAQEPDLEVSLNVLKTWGKAAHIGAPTGAVEAQCLHEALHRDPIRSRFAHQLIALPVQEGESELQWLGRLAQATRAIPGDRDLHEAAGAILCFERCYALVALAFERLLFLAGHSEVQLASETMVRGDLVLQTATKKFPRAVRKLEAALESGVSEAFVRDQARLHDICGFLRSAATRTEVLDFVESVVQRHSDVQRGKLDQGRPKLAWLERKAKGWEPTLARVGDIPEPLSVDDVKPHPYRVGSCQALVVAAEGRALA